MPGQKEMSRGRLVQRLITFYAILAVIGVAVVIFVVDKGGSEKAQPAIAGGYAASARQPVHRTRAQAGRWHPAAGDRAGAGRGDRDRRSTCSSPGSSSTSPTTRARSAGQLRLNAKTLPGNAPPPDRDRRLRVRRQVAEPRRDRDAGSQGRDRRARSAGFRSPPRCKTAPPPPGAAAPRTPSNIQGTFALSPGVDVLRQLVLDSRHAARWRRSTPRPARTSDRSPTRPRPAACSATSSA